MVRPTARTPPQPIESLSPRKQPVSLSSLIRFLLVDDLAVDEGDANLHVVDVRNGDLEGVAIEDQDVCKQSHLNASRPIAVAHLTCRIHREHLEGLLQRDLLRAAEHLRAAARLLPGNECFQSDPGIY